MAAAKKTWKPAAGTLAPALMRLQQFIRENWVAEAEEIGRRAAREGAASHVVEALRSIGAVHLFGAEKVELLKVAESLQKEFPGAFRIDYLKNRAVESAAFLAARDSVDEEACLSVAHQLLQWLEAFIRPFHAAVPIEGLRFEPSKPVAVGDVVLSPIDMADYLKRVRETLLEERIRELVQRCASIARVSVRAGDMWAAGDLALQHVEMALAILRVLFCSRGSKAGLGMRVVGEEPWTSEVLFFESVQGDVATSYAGSTVAYTMRGMPLRFGKDERRALERTGLGKMTDLFSERPTEGVGRVRRTLLAASGAVLEEEPADSFFGQAKALEILLGGGASERGLPLDTIRNRLGERVAFLLGQDAGQRQDMWREVGQLYDKASAVRHGSGKDVSLADISRLERYVAAAIVEFARRSRHIEDFREFTAWIEEARFALPGGFSV